MGVTHEELREISRQYSNLTSDKRCRLIAYLLYYFSQSARMSYVDAGCSEIDASRRLRALNEVVQVLSKQALALAGAWKESSAYPDHALFGVLMETLEIGCPEREAFLGPVYDAFRQILRPESG